MKERALRQLGEIETWVEQRQLHTQINNNSRRGIITSELLYLSLLEVLEEVHDKPDILKLAMVYPVPGRVIIEFLKSHDEVKILEELDDELERSIKAIAYDQQISTKITGKNDIYDWIGEYTPDKVRQILRNTWPGLIAEGEETSFFLDDIPARPSGKRG